MTLGTILTTVLLPKTGVKKVYVGGTIIVFISLALMSIFVFTD